MNVVAQPFATCTIAGQSDYETDLEFILKPREKPREVLLAIRFVRRATSFIDLSANVTSILLAENQSLNLRLVINSKAKSKVRQIGGKVRDLGRARKSRKS